MTAGKRKTQRKEINLEISNVEKANFMEKLRRNLQHSINEARFCKMMLQYETVIINGQLVFSNDALNGLIM